MGQDMNFNSKGPRMKFFRSASLALLLATGAFAADTLLVRTAPDGAAPYNPGLSYADFNVPAGYWVKSIYGGFSGAGLPESRQTFDAQFNPGGGAFASPAQNPLWDPDTARASMYNAFRNLSDTAAGVPGTLRISFPGNASGWGLVCVTLSPMGDTRDSLRNLNAGQRENRDTLIFRKAPDGAAPYGPDWSYADFEIPADRWIKILYGGFSRPGYPDTMQVFDAQYNAGEESFTSLSQNRLWNPDSAHASMYGVPLHLSGSGIVPWGTLRVSLPTGKSAKWNFAFVILSPSAARDYTLPTYRPRRVSRDNM